MFQVKNYNRKLLYRKRPESVGLFLLDELVLIKFIAECTPVYSKEK